MFDRIESLLEVAIADFHLVALIKPRSHFTRKRQRTGDENFPFENPGRWKERKQMAVFPYRYAYRAEVNQ